MNKYIGKKLEGRYEILELVGFGGMAVVFRARDIKEDRFVAVKILKEEYLQNEDFKRRFRNESKAIALLSHPNIVKVLDVNFSDTIQYIVMEYIDGITLKEYIGQQKVVRWKEAVHFTVQILRALQHAHDNGIVHRDIKPQNVMLLEDGTIKVMDFGIARFARENGKTLSDKAIGSVHYISPEQARGEPTDEKTDVYAVGVIMYEMLTGSVPFDGETPVSIAIKQMQNEPKRPTLLKADIPFGLEEIILRAMQKDPQLRYQTAAEMLRDIDEFKHNPDVVFEYKYFNQDGTTRYFDRVDAKGKTVSAVPAKRHSYTMNILAGVAAACVILMVIAVIFFVKSLSTRADTFTLPNLSGLTFEAAQTKNPQLKLSIEGKEASVEFEPNVIMDQSPKPSTIVKAGSEVKVTVSVGRQSFVLPDLAGETVAEAKKLLTEAELTVEQISQPSSSVEAGLVITTDPPAEAELKKGDKVVLYVSYGSADLPARVPQLIGKSELDAVSALMEQGLNLGSIIAQDSEEPAGMIIWQSVEPETKVDKGTMIDITISSGTAPSVTIPLRINFPQGSVDASYGFDISVNGVYMQSKSVNPAKDKAISLSFTLQSGKINGAVASNGSDTVTITTAGGQFASYRLNFSRVSYSVLAGPNFALVQDFGTPEPESEPEPEVVE